MRHPTSRRLAQPETATCVDTLTDHISRQPVHLVRRGRTHQPPPPATRTSRHRADPHPTNRAEHPGHLNRPAARSLSTAEPVPDTVNTVVPPRATARPSRGMSGKTPARGRTVRWRTEAPRC